MILINKLGIVFVVSIRDFFRVNSPYIAAGISYWTIFSLFPLCLAVISIWGFFNPEIKEEAKIIGYFADAIPVSSEYLKNLLEEVISARGTIGIVSLVGLSWTGLIVFSAIRKGINHSWNIDKTANFVMARFIDLMMLMGGALFVIIFVFLNGIAFGFSNLFSFLDADYLLVISRVALEIPLLFITFCFMLILYKFVPNIKISWKDIWLGSLIAGILFRGIQMVFAYSFHWFSPFNVIYGSIGWIVTLLLWAYLSSISILYGGQFCQTYSRMFGSLKYEYPIDFSFAFPKWKINKIKNNSVKFLVNLLKGN